MLLLLDQKINQLENKSSQLTILYAKYIINLEK